MQKRREKDTKAGRRESWEVGAGGRKNNRKDRTKRGNWGKRKSQEGKIKGQKECELAGQGGAGAGEEQQPLPPAQEGVERKGRQDLESLIS